MKPKKLDLLKLTNKQRGLVSQFLLEYNGTQPYIKLSRNFSEPDKDDTYQFAQPLLLKTPNLTKLTLKPLYLYPQYYVVGEKLGQGAYGSVAKVGYKIKLTDTGYQLKKYSVPYVIKMQRKPKKGGVKFKENVEREYALLEGSPQLQGKNFAYNKKQTKAFFLMKEIQGALLWNEINQRYFFTVERRKAMTQALLLAYDEQLYNQSIIHGDIKPENIIVNKSDAGWQATFVDFGFSRKVDNVSEGCFKNVLIGTPAYLIARFLPGQGYRYNCDSDVWALVVTLSELWGLRLDDYDNDKPEDIPCKVATQIINCEDLPAALRAYAKEAHESRFLNMQSKEDLFAALRKETALSPRPRSEVAKPQAELPQSTYAFEGLMTGLVLTLAIGLAATIIVLTHGAAAIFLLTAFTALSTTVTLPGSIGLLIAAGSVLPIIGGLIGKRISQAPSPTLFAVSTSKQSSSSVSSSVASTLKLAT